MPPFERLGVTRYQADEWYQQALDAYQQRKLADAILKMNEAIALLTSRAEYYAARGFFYLEDANVPKAEADFAQALKINSLEMLAHYGRGLIAYEQKQWEQALGHFQQAFKGAPARPECQYHLALAHHRLGQNVQALYFMQSAAKALEGQNDKRKGDAQRWVKELQKLVEAAAPKIAPKP
jgi:tetratricopeptide (TPR) repeat protein